MTRSSRRRALFVVMAALLLGAGELVALNQFAIREITWAYPDRFDQAFYGHETFWRYVQIRTQGLLPLLSTLLPLGGPQGVLLQLQGVVMCVVFGPGWLQLLNVNFLYFLLLQGATGYVAWHAGGKRLRWAVLSLGLVLLLATPYHAMGGAMDFRLDFAALCLYGALIATVVRSEVFASRPWSLVAGGVAGTLVWLRVLTLTYVLAIGVLMIAYLCLRLKAGSAPKLLNAGLWLGTVIALTAPLVILRAPALYAYYWVGHIAGPERDIRARELGLEQFWEHLRFYPKMLVKVHLGSMFLAVAGLVLLVALGRWLSDRRERKVAMDDRLGLDAFVFCLMGLGVPLVVLTLDASKSDAVTGIMDSAIVWLVILGARWLAGPRLLRGRVGAGLAILVLVAGLGHMSRELARHRLFWYERAEIGRLLETYDQMTSAAVAMEVSEAQGFSVFGLYEYMNVGVLNFLAYERHRYPLDLRGELGSAVFATNLDDAIGKIDKSVFVVTSSKRPESELVYPLDRTLRMLTPVLTQYVRERFICMTRFTFKGQHHAVYRRAVALLRGTSGGWVTADGLMVEISEQDSRRAARLVLKGTSDMSRVAGLEVSAVTMEPRQRPINVDFRALGNDYTISIPLAGLSAEGGRLSLRLTFSKSFVPRDLGINADTRRLVLRTPRERALLLKAPPTDASPQVLQDGGRCEE